MKKIIFVMATVFITYTGVYSQDKKEIKTIEKEYVMSSHDKFYMNKDWAMCKFSIVYKLTTAMTAGSMDRDISSNTKVKTSSGAYATLNGITEDDLQTLTNKIAENFIKRMKDECGVNVATWSSFKNSENADDLIKAQEEREIYSKSQGLAYALSYDSTPHYNRVINFVPGGKKLAKELNKNVMEMSLYIDFADVKATANADIGLLKWSESATQNIYPGVRLIPNLGSQGLDNMLGATTIKGHDLYGYYFIMGLSKDLVSTLSFADKIEKSEGKIPAILSNRKNNKIEYPTTFDIYTTHEKYTAAVMDVTNKYFDNFIKVYNFHSKE